MADAWLLTLPRTSSSVDDDFPSLSCYLGKEAVTVDHLQPQAMIFLTDSHIQNTLGEEGRTSAPIGA